MQCLSLNNAQLHVEHIHTQLSVQDTVPIKDWLLHCNFTTLYMYIYRYEEQKYVNFSMITMTHV